MTFVSLTGPLPRPECTGTTPTVPNLTQFAPPLQCALAIGRVCCDIFRDACFRIRPVLLMLPAHCVVHAVVRLGAAWDCAVHAVVRQQGAVYAVVRLGAAWDCMVHGVVRQQGAVHAVVRLGAAWDCVVHGVVRQQGAVYAVV